MDYDVIIIGAGPNGLEAGAYLSKADLKVLLLERRYESGGGLATEEITLPGYFHNTHAVYMMMVDYAPIYQDMRLEEVYRCSHIYPSLQFALPLSDGRSVCIYSDLEKTCESFAKFSKKDADTYRELYHTLKRYMDEFLAPATYALPSPTLDAVVKMQSTQTGKEVMEYSEKSAKQIIDDLFENEHIKALMLYLACMWGVDYDQAGIGYLVLLYLNRATHYRLVKGGSHAVASALGKIIHENGGVTINNQRIRKILVEDGTARGVEMEDGVIHHGKAVISTIDPHQTFLKLVGEENLGEDFTEKINSWQWEKESLFQVSLALEERPKFLAAGGVPDLDNAFIHVLGYETQNDLIAELDAVYRGEVSERAGFNCCFPSIHDPSQAPPDRCTGSISMKAPYNLEGESDKWLKIKFKEEMAERCLSTLQRYAPNLTRDKVLWYYVCTPADIEHKFCNMVEGSFKQGAYHPLQMGYQRPNDECSQTRTPIKNLYLGGSACYPGGCVIWGAGYNAANTVAEDLGVEKWWKEPELVVEAKKQGLI